MYGKNLVTVFLKWNLILEFPQSLEIKKFEDN